MAKTTLIRAYPDGAWAVRTHRAKCRHAVWLPRSATRFRDMAINGEAEFDS